MDIEYENDTEFEIDEVPGQTGAVQSVNGKTGAVVLTTEDIKDTSGKSIDEKIENKVDKVTGKGLSTNDYTNADKEKLASITPSSYSLVTETGKTIDLEIDEDTYELVAKLYDKNNNLISTSSVIDLPLESLVVGMSYDSATKELVITLKSGATTRVPIGDIITGLATQSYVDNAISTEDTSIKAWADAKFLTEHQSLDDYYTKSEVDDIADGKVDNFTQTTISGTNYQVKDIQIVSDYPATEQNGVLYLKLEE